MESELTLTKLRIQSGVWEGILIAPDDRLPAITVTHLEQPIHAVSVSPAPEDPKAHIVRIAIPPDLLSDGVQTFLISDTATGALLSSFAIIAGEPMEDDIRAEIDLLRAELDMLKKAFRRHCVEQL